MIVVGADHHRFVRRPVHNGHHVPSRGAVPLEGLQQRLEAGAPHLAHDVAGRLLLPGRPGLAPLEALARQGLDVLLDVLGERDPR